MIYEVHQTIITILYYRNIIFEEFPESFYIKEPKVDNESVQIVPRIKFSRYTEILSVCVC